MPVRLSSAAPVLLVALVALLAGCGPDCQSSCDKIFGDQADQCGIVVPGQTAETMTRECVAHCEQALAENGEIGDYNPDVRATSGNDGPTLDNEKQAALWMDCVEETSCDYLNNGYCAPVKNFPAN
jgi:hypothetical protein